MQAKVVTRIAAVCLLAMAAACAGSGGNASDTGKGATAVAGGPTNDPAVRKTIDAADSAFSVAFKNADAAAAAAFYEQDAMSMPPNAEPLSGRSAIEKGFADTFKGMGKITDFVGQAKDVDIYGDHAVEVGTYSLTFQPPGAKEPAKDHGGYINYWRKQSDGSWKIHRDAIVSATPLPMPAPPPGAKK